MLASRHGGTASTADVVEMCPHSIEAEQAVLGSLLADASQFEAVSELLVAEDFYQVGHRQVFEALARLHGAGQMIDPLTLANQLMMVGALEQCGGMSYLEQLQSVHGAGHGLLEHAGIVRERSMLRRLRNLAQSVTRACSGPKLPASAELVDRLEAGLMEIQHDRGRDKPAYRAIAELAPGFIDALDQRCQASNPVTGVAHEVRWSGSAPGSSRRGRCVTRVRVTSANS